MHVLILLVLLALLILGPQWWVRYVLARYNRREEAFPGTGGELARHLLRRFQLEAVKVVPAEGVGDHYDPDAREVRLTPDNMERRSLTAIATAAHEVGHAIQHAAGYRPFLWRQRLARLSQVSARVGSFLLFAVPVLTLITKTPAAGLLMLLGAAGTLGISVLVQLMTLPVAANPRSRLYRPVPTSWGAPYPPGLCLDLCGLISGRVTQFLALDEAHQDLILRRSEEAVVAGILPSVSARVVNSSTSVNTLNLTNCI
jgi:Zn-dependent membrane protease YugP